jgi:hypothetical protein
MNAIIFYEYNMFITGSTMNMFEYFLCAYEHNKDIKLVLINASKPTIKKFIDIIKNRYVLDGIEDFENNIIQTTKGKILRMKFDTVLVIDYNTIKETRGLLRAEKIIVISEKHTESYFYNKALYNVTYYGEMPFHYKDCEYRMKLLFDRYKKLGDVKKGTYVNSPRNDDFSFLNDLQMPHLSLPFIFKSKTNHKENLFEQFDNYLYYHANTWFDPHPRLFLECRYYNKPITYVNPYKIKDGSWYRYEDLLSRGLYDRTLNKNDEIIGQLI